MIEQLFGWGLGVGSVESPVLGGDRRQYLASMLAMQNAQLQNDHKAPPRFRSINPKQRMSDRAIKLFQVAHLLRVSP
jgi:hypothetical protein